MGTCKNPGTCRADCLFTCVPCATTFADLREADRAAYERVRDLIGGES